MTPNAPVKNFKLPRFGDEGFTQWVLQGGRGIYDSESQVRVEEMALRVYSGDERLVRELMLQSPEGTIRLQENRAFSDAAIKIDGANFKISGMGWEWQGDSREIRVAANTEVEFAQNISGGMAVAVDGPRRTSIFSDELMLKTTESEYEFEFTGAVRASSGDWRLTSETLIALADVPEGSEGEFAEGGQGQLDLLRKIIARKDVVFQQGDRTVRAAEAEFFTEDRRAILRGKPSIEVVGAYLTGQRVETRAGEVIIRGSPDAGRAQMILLDTGGLGLQGKTALSSETIVLANVIRLEETPDAHRFSFDGKVEVFSGAVQLNADMMTVLADRMPDPGVETLREDDLKLGRVSIIQAKGAVRIEQGGQVATSDEVTFYPETERAVLVGNPVMSNGVAVVRGQSMELRPQMAIVRGAPDELLRVELPELPDLGYDISATVEPRSDRDSDEAAVDSSNPILAGTVVRSERLKMIEENDQTIFRFTDSVSVKATNLLASCRRMEVIADPAGSSGGRLSTSALQVRRIDAFDNLRIEQKGRKAWAERGTILPNEGKLVLEENAVVEDDRGRASGFRLTLLKDQRRALVEGSGSESERARITLPGLAEGKF